MNKITHFLGMLCLLPAIAMAQITIVETDITQVGDVIPRNVDTLAAVTQGGAGANQTWDMTNAVAHNTETTQVIAPSATPYASGFPNANLAMTNDNATFLYFDQNTAMQVAQGFAGDLLGTGTALNVPFNPTLLVHNFPITYGSNFSDTYGLDVTTDGSAFGVSEVRYKRMAIVLDSTDAWGMLTTPDGSYNSLRIKHVEYIKDSIWAKLFPFAPFQLFSATNDTTVAYNWFAKESKLPVAELTLDSVGGPSQFTWFAATVGVENGVSAQIQAKMYPIPAANQVNIRISANDKAGEHAFSLYNAEGKLISTSIIDLQVGKNHAFDLRQLPVGVYTWSLKNGSNGKEVHGKLPIVR